MPPAPARRPNSPCRRPNGSDDIKGKGLANCADCGSQWDGKQTAPVGSFTANAWGLHDMHGNVFEWVEDCLHQNYEDAPADGTAWRAENGGDCSARVLRGGSWDDARDVARSAGRGGSSRSSGTTSSVFGWCVRRPSLSH